MVDSRKKPDREPLNASLVLLVEALADANALRDHQMTLATREAARKGGKDEARSDLRSIFDRPAK